MRDLCHKRAQSELHILLIYYFYYSRRRTVASRFGHIRPSAAALAGDCVEGAVTTPCATAEMAASSAAPCRSCRSMGRRAARRRWTASPSNKLRRHTTNGPSIYGRLRRLGNAPQIAGERTTVVGAFAIQDRKQSCKPANVCGPNSFDALCKCHKQTRAYDDGPIKVRIKTRLKASVGKTLANRFAATASSACFTAAQAVSV